jgi:ADP-ribose pyrophosphatase YjhB (NUDIX family)
LTDCSDITIIIEQRLTCRALPCPQRANLFWENIAMQQEPAVQVAVAVIPDADGRYLWTWNAQWGEFTLPMTKLRLGAERRESPEHAALRAGAEALAVPVRVLPGTLRLPFPRESFSGRLRETRGYLYHIFGVEPHPDFARRLSPRTPHLWLTASEALEKNYEPLSESSRDVVDRVLLLIPPEPRSLMRRSRAALAVVCRKDADGRPRWLAQWNSGWKRYHFVGGHKRRTESFRDCLIREAADELGLTEGSDFTVDEQPLRREAYIARSERYQQDTQYDIELFRMRLRGDEAVARIAADPFNRWLSADEIRAGRCGDGQLVNDTMHQLLEQAGWPL